MNCPHCHKPALPSHETLSRDVGGGVTVSVKVPCFVCLDCADSFVAHNDLATLDIHAKAFVRAFGERRPSTLRRWTRGVRQAAFDVAAVVALVAPLMLMPEDDE